MDSSNKIKVLYILDTLLIGGSENVAIDLCNNIDRNKFQVHFIVLTNDRLVQLDRINKDVSLTILPVKEKYVSGLRSLLFIFKGLPELVGAMNKVGADIIHTHSYLHRLLFIIIALKLSSMKKATHFQTIHMLGGYYNAIGILNKFKLYIDRVILRITKPYLVGVSDPVTEKSKDVFRNCYRTIQCIENGVDLSKFSKSNFSDSKRSMGFSDTDFIIVYPSRLDSGKGHLTLLKAIDLLKGEIKNLKLCLLGDGKERSMLEEYVALQALGEQVIFKGSVQNVPEILAVCDIGVFPSESEGLSIAMLEMIAMELPIVCSDIASFRKIFKEDEALFFSVSDHRLLAQQIYKLYEDTELRKSYAVKSKGAVQSYSLTKMILKHEAYYEAYSTI